MMASGLGVLDPDARCPLTPSRKDGLAVRFESHRGLEFRPSPLGGRLRFDDSLNLVSSQRSAGAAIKVKVHVA